MAPVHRRSAAFRRSLRSRFGIKVTREIHTSRFIRDCSDNIADRKLNLGHRKHAYELCLRQVASMNSLRLINVCLRIGGRPLQTVHRWAIERLINRINRTMEAQGSHAVVIFDDGKEAEITKLTRRIAVFNPIPSQFGAWQNGALYRNIAAIRVVDDPRLPPIAPIAVTPMRRSSCVRTP